METKNKPVFIAFSSQKGGVGKSTFTTLAASTLHYRLGYNVAVFDADFPQLSLMKMKARDLAMVMENEVLKRIAYTQFTTINKRAYPIIQHKAEGVLEAANDFLESSKVPIDVIFFDLPGTVNTPGILNALAGMHHIFTPITADRFVMESTLVFTQLMRDIIMKKGETSIKSVNLFWNQVDGRERSPLYDIYNKLIDDLGFSLMKCSIMNSTPLSKRKRTLYKVCFPLHFNAAGQTLDEGLPVRSVYGRIFKHCSIIKLWKKIIRKKTTPEIDEALMMDIMADGVKKEGLTPPLEEHKPSPEPLHEKSLIKERTRMKRGTDADYEAIFFKKTHTNARDGKTVYIQPDFHEKLSRIVQVIGEDKLAIYAYLNNVLEYHFQEFGEQITKSFNEKYKPIL